MKPIVPYVWTQNHEAIDITFPVPLHTRSREIDVQITKEGIKAGKKNHPVVIEGTFYEEIKDSLWQLESNTVTIHIDKLEYGFWPVLLTPGDKKKLDPHSQFEYAHFLEEGVGGQPDTEAAFENYKDSANRGSELAQLKMVEILLGRDPSFRNVEEDPQGAFDYCYMAATQNNNANALFDLGMFHEQGAFGVEQDYDKAEEYFTKAAAQNHWGSMYSLGRMYRKGDDEHPPQIEKAIMLWRRAAELGSPEACYALGVAFWMGDGLPIDLNMALAFFEKAQELDKEKEIPELLLKNIQEAEDKAKELKKEEENFQKTRHKKLGHQETPPNYTLLAGAALALGAIVLFSYFAKNR